MPQIEQLTETLASQFFWVLLFFGFVFFVVGKGMLPKVMATVDARDRQISEDLAAAEAARKAADEAEEAWRIQANQQRAEAHGLIAQAKADAASATEARLAAANAKIDARLAEADARIESARQVAVGEVENVAADAATDIVARLAGITIEGATARAAVKEALNG